PRPLFCASSSARTRTGHTSTSPDRASTRPHPSATPRRRPPAPQCAPSSRSRRPRAEKQVLHAVEVNVIIATCGQSDSVSFRPEREKWKDKTESCVPPAYSQLRGVIRE